MLMMTRVRTSCGHCMWSTIQLFGGLPFFVLVHQNNKIKNKINLHAELRECFHPNIDVDGDAQWMGPANYYAIAMRTEPKLECGHEGGSGGGECNACTNRCVLCVGGRTIFAKVRVSGGRITGGEWRC